MQAHLQPDPSRGAGYGILILEGFEGRDANVLFSLRRSSDRKYLGSSGWSEAEQRLAPDMPERKATLLRLLVGPAVVDMADALENYAITVYPAAGGDKLDEPCRLEVGNLVYSNLAGGQGVGRQASAPPPMPEKLAPAPKPQPEPEPEPVVSVLKTPGQAKSKAPLLLLLLLLAFAALATGIYLKKSPSATGGPSETGKPQQAAEQGEAAAWNRLGFAYQHGRGAAKDERKAVEWYQKAAEQGYAAAQNNLGFMYEHGNGVAKDERKAVEWYQKAAEQGHASAQFNLGDCYEYGRGVAKDERKAVEWYRKAAKQGGEGGDNAKKALERLQGRK